MSATKSTAAKDSIVLPPINVETMTATIVGDTELICHAWSDKAKREMLDKQMKAAKPGKEAKDPSNDYLDSLYRIEGEENAYGFPSVAIKDAMVTACTSVGGVTKVAARQAFRVVGERVDVRAVYGGIIIRQDLVRIISNGPRMREDMVRVGIGVADIRYRGEFYPWVLQFQIAFNGNLLSAAQILNLLNTAGFGVGIGEWRPERNGQSGTFHVATEADLPLLRELGVEIAQAA